MKPRIGFCVLVLCLTTAAMPDRQSDDPWDDSELLAPTTLAAQLKTLDPTRLIVFAGSASAYTRSHIPRALFAGPGAKQRGRDLLSEALKNVPHETVIVVYCGCCPFVRCPNIRAAYKALHELGYIHIRVLKLTTDLNTDWVEKGFPIQLSTN